MGVGVAFDIDHQANRLPGALAGFVADGGNTFDALVFDEFADILCEAVAGLLVGDLGDDDLLLASLLVHMGPSTQGDPPASGGIAFKDSLSAAYEAACGEIGPWQDLEDAENGGIGFIDK